MAIDGNRANRDETDQGDELSGCYGGGNWLHRGTASLRRRCYVSRGDCQRRAPARTEGCSPKYPTRNVTTPSTLNAAEATEHQRTPPWGLRPGGRT